MSPTLHPTLSAVLGKAKVGGLVLAATVLVAGTANAATGAAFLSEKTDDVVATEPVTDPVDCPTDPVDDGTTLPGDVVPTDPVDDGTTLPGDVVPTDPVDDGTACEEPVDDPVTDPVTDPVDDPVEDPVTDPVTDPVDEPVDDACETATNHGQYVSGVAHSTPPGPGHGAAVSAAAHSDCGKPHRDDADEPADDTADDTSSQDSGSWTPPGQAKKDDSASTSSAPGNSGNAPGHASSSSGSSGAPGNSGNAPGHNK